MLAHTPVPEKRERWRVLIERGYSAEQLQESLESVLFVFGQMEQELAQHGPWLAGPTFSLGDISMAAIVHRTREIYPTNSAEARSASQRMVGTFVGAAGGEIRLQ